MYSVVQIQPYDPHIERRRKFMIGGVAVLACLTLTFIAVVLPMVEHSTTKVHVVFGGLSYFVALSYEYLKLLGHRFRRDIDVMDEVLNTGIAVFAASLATVAACGLWEVIHMIAIQEWAAAWRS